jgi:hypothetical protein
MKKKSARRKHRPRPPFVIDGSRVLYYSLLGPTVSYSGKGLILVGGRDLGPVPRLILSESLRKKEFLVLHCDRNWNAVAHDGSYPSLKDAKRRAERMYPGVTKTWEKWAITKRKALAIERKQWSGYECSFCNRIPIEFDQSCHAKKAVICNICVDRLFWDFLESKQTSERPPRGEYYPENAFAQIESYISRLVAPSEKYKSLSFYALDQMRGCNLLTVRQILEVWFMVKAQQENQQEVKIRSFFASREMRPSRDYLANNGGTRILDYPLTGTVDELTEMVKTILQELCDISPKEPLSIDYKEHKRD